MKAEKNQSKMKTSGVGTVVTAFVTGAAAGLAVGALIRSNKNSGLKDKLKGLIADFGVGAVSSAIAKNKSASAEESTPAGYVQETDIDTKKEDNQGSDNNKGSYNS